LLIRAYEGSSLITLSTPATYCVRGVGVYRSKFVLNPPFAIPSYVSKFLLS